MAGGEVHTKAVERYSELGYNSFGPVKQSNVLPGKEKVSVVYSETQKV